MPRDAAAVRLYAHNTNTHMYAGVLPLVLTDCRGSGGQASIVCYDLCIAADAEGGGGLVASALHGLADRKAAHKHPSAHKHATGSQQYPVAAEQEYKAWHDMPNAPQLTALLGGTTSTGSSRCGSKMGAGVHCCAQKLPCAHASAATC